MPVIYSCDNCGKNVEHLRPIRIVGSDRVEILCRDCWKPIEDQLPLKEATSANEK